MSGRMREPGGVVTQRELLDRLRRDVDRLTHEAEAIVAGLRVPQLEWTPRRGAWSISHCLEHLAVTADQYRPRIEAACDNPAAKPDPEGAFRPTWLGRWFIAAVGPEGTKRFKVPKVFQPSSRPPPDAMERFRASQRWLGSAIDRARAVDLNRARLRSPVSAFVRFSVGEALAILVGHAERHLRQARRVRESPQLPGA